MVSIEKCGSSVSFQISFYIYLRNVLFCSVGGFSWPRRLLERTCAVDACDRRCSCNMWQQMFHQGSAVVSIKFQLLTVAVGIDFDLFHVVSIGPSGGFNSGMWWCRAILQVISTLFSRFFSKSPRYVQCASSGVIWWWHCLQFVSGVLLSFHVWFQLMYAVASSDLTHCRHYASGGCKQVPAIAPASSTDFGLLQYGLS